MTTKVIACLAALFQFCLIISVSAENDNFFKVPLEIREQNRPQRLVDDAADPDMIKLKILQDKFFTLVGNSSLGNEFKSFNQLLKLVDSEAGLELGRLLMNGFMIGFGKKNSNNLFMEFIDDFKYRLSPDFADALMDYKDFLKTVDLKLIPVTIQTLFRKDELGNSLAQIPLGQLVDLVQPEASKYGIDIRSMINGILGKGDSTFPDLVEKIMNNLNASTILKGITNSIMDDDEILPQGAASNAVGERKRAMQDPRLVIFKPMIAKLLKQYNIDLDVDAVIRVLTPFVNGGSELFSKLFSGSGEGGAPGGFNLAQLAPLLGLLAAGGAAGLGGKGKSAGPDLLQAAMAMMGGGGPGNNNMDLSSILNIASQFMGSPKSRSKSGKSQKRGAKEPGFDFASVAGLLGQLSSGNGNVDTGSLLQMASSFLGAAAKNKDKSSDNDVTESQEDDVNVDPGKLLELAANLLENMNPKSQKVGKSTEVRSQGAKSKSLFDVLGPFLLRLQKDKNCHRKIEDAFSFGKAVLASKMMSLEDLKQMLPLLLASQTTGTPYANIDTDALLGVLSFSLHDWADFATQMNQEKFREMLVENTILPAVEVIQMISTDEFQQKQNEMLKEKIREGFSSIGLKGKGLTIDNFPDRLKPMAEMASKGWDLPISLATLLGPLKTTLKNTWYWYTNGVKDMKNLPQDELIRIVRKSLENDFAKSVVEIVAVAETSKSSSTCLAREVCDVIGDVSSSHPDTLKLTVMRLGSIVYGGFRSYREDNFPLFLQVTRAASMGSDCEKYFPIRCPEAIPSPKEKPEAKKEEPIVGGENMHEEL